MTVPSFADIGKNAWDIFKTGYHYGYGLFKFTITNKSERGLQLNADYTLNCDNSKADSRSEVKLDLDRFGIFKTKWGSDGTMKLEYGKERMMEGLGATGAFSYNPMSTATGFRWAAKFHNDHLNVDLSAAHALDANVEVTGAGVLGYKDLYLGYRIGYDTESETMTMNDLGLAYAYDKVGVHLRATSIPIEWGASVYYRVNEKWDTAINGIYASRHGHEHWTVGIGTRIKIDDGSTVRMKLNKDRQLGLSLQQKIHEFVKLTLSFNLDFNNLTSGDHKVGLALDIDDSHNKNSLEK